MRKFILIAAMVLASASAQAGQPRGLTVASNDDAAAVAQPATTDAATPADAPQPAETPKFVERPSPVDAKATPDQPKADRARPVARAEKKRHRESTEARVIYELHRYGVYW